MGGCKRLVSVGVLEVTDYGVVWLRRCVCGVGCEGLGLRISPHNLNSAP